MVVLGGLVNFADQAATSVLFVVVCAAMAGVAILALRGFIKSGITAAIILAGLGCVLVLVLSNLPDGPKLVNDTVQEIQKQAPSVKPSSLPKIGG